MNVSNGGRAAVPENSTVVPLNHNFTLSSEWNRDERSLLDELLARHASETRLFQFAMIGKVLGIKSVRDVAFWRKSVNKEIGKQKKGVNGSSMKKRAKKEKIVEQQPESYSHATIHANGLPYAQSSVSMDSDDNISYKAFGGALGQLLEKNAQAFDQISANFSAFKLHENINLFCQTRNNILAILNNLNNMPEVMKKLPPLPVKLNDELASSILPQI